MFIRPCLMFLQIMNFRILNIQKAVWGCLSVHKYHFFGPEEVRSLFSQKRKTTLFWPKAPNLIRVRRALGNTRLKDFLVFLNFSLQTCPFCRRMDLCLKSEIKTAKSGSSPLVVCSVHCTQGSALIWTYRSPSTPRLTWFFLSCPIRATNQEAQKSQWLEHR